MAQNGTVAPAAWSISNDLWQRPIAMQPGALPSVDSALDSAITIEDPYYIAATSPPADEYTRVLKQGETFAVFDHFGDIKPTGMHEEGVYHEGTRFLSSLILRLGRDRPLFLSSNVKRDNAVLTVDLTNPDIQADGSVIPHGTVHLSRSKFLWEGCCYERLRLRNHGMSRVQLSLSMQFRADFVDIFEVRGTKRTRR